MIHGGVIDGGLTVLGVARIGNQAFPDGHKWQAIPTETDFGGQTFVAGDLAVCADLAISSDATIPTSVTPSGWTNLFTDTATVGGVGTRFNAAYKILSASDIGTEFTGMNGSDVERKIMLIFKMNRAVQSVTVEGTNNRAPSSGDMAAINLLGAAEVGNVLQVGFALCENAFEAADFPWTPAAVGSPHQEDPDGAEGSGSSATRIAYNYWPRHIGTVVNESIDIGDNGDFNAIGAAYFTLT